MISRYSSSLYSLCRSAYIPMRTFASNQELFEKAQANVKTLTEEPDVDVKLQMYALFKQATVGDVQGSRPGMMDFAGRAKFDAWTKVKGISKEEAQAKYAKIVESLLGEQSPPPAAGSTPMGLKPVEGLDGIMAALDASNKDKSTSITVITGAGDFFCSGNDLSNFAKAASASKEEVKEMAETAAVVLKEYIQAYIDHEKPLVCLINGPAVGIAVTVLPLFDYVLATDKSTFHTPFSTLGQSPEGASSYTFPILMGQLRASEFLILNKKFSAHQALEAGLVNEIECKTICERWQSKECAAAIAAFLSRSKK
ncbi:enoyl-CoA hydratase/isomerase family protein [Ostertagia ostertagi]